MRWVETRHYLLEPQKIMAITCSTQKRREGCERIFNPPEKWKRIDNLLWRRSSRLCWKRGLPRRLESCGTWTKSTYDDRKVWIPVTNKSRQTRRKCTGRYTIVRYDFDSIARRLNRKRHVYGNHLWRFPRTAVTVSSYRFVGLCVRLNRSYPIVTMAGRR